MNETAEGILVSAPNEWTWAPLNEFRLIATVQGQQSMGPALQRAWRCAENGRVEWRTLPTHYVNVSEYLDAVSPAQKG